MALPAAKQPKNDDVIGAESPAAANDDIEIVEATGVKKAEIKGNKLKISVEVPKFKLDAAPMVANDNLEIDDTEPIAKPGFSPKPTAFDQKSQPNIPDSTPKQEGVIEPKDNLGTSTNRPQTPPQTTTKSNPIEQQNFLEDEPENQNTPTLEENEIPELQQDQILDKEQNDKPETISPNNQPTPGNINDTKKEFGISDANPNLTKLPPKKPGNEELTQTGPHVTNKTPNKVKPNDQEKKSSDLSQSKSLAGSIGAGLSNKINNIKRTISEAPKNFISKIKNDLESDRSRKKQLGQQRRQLESELRRLEDKVDGIKSLGAMRVIRYALPTVYSTIMGFTTGIKNANDKAKLPILEAKLNSLKTVKGLLSAAKIGTALASAAKTTISLIAAGFELFIIPGILLLIISPFIILVLWIKNLFTLKDALTAAVEKIEKEVNEVIIKLNSIVEPVRKRIRIRQEIQNVNRLMAATKKDRKNYLNEQQESNNNKPIDQNQQAA